MNYSDEEIFVFIHKHLREHVNILTRIFRSAIRKNKNVDTGTLLNSIKTLGITRDADGGVSATIELAEYGRLMEIGGRRRKIQNRNHEVWESKNHPARQKKTAWYNKNKYKGFGTLQRQLITGISEHELQEIHNIIERSGLGKG